MMSYPKNPRENKIFRINILDRCSKDLAFRKSILKKCDDPLFFFNVLLWTFNPRLAENGSDGNLPFITYEYQDKMILKLQEAIEKGIDIWLEKSRDMGFTWVLLGFQIWAWIFKDWSSLYGSYKEDYVDEKGNMDSHFERLRYALERLPEWVVPKGTSAKYMGISAEDKTADISGDAGENFGTGGRRKFVILDEFPLWQFDEKALRKTKDVTNCRIFGGTPEGKFNVYGKVMTGHEDYEHLKKIKIALHWTLHPDKAKGVKRVSNGKLLTSEEAFKCWRNGIAITSPWYEEQKASRTALDLAKEVDISYSASVTNRVYPSIETKWRIGKFQYEDGSQYCNSVTWDYGLDMNAFIFVQKNMITGRNKIVKTFQKKNVEIDFMAGFFTGYPIAGYKYTPEELELIEFMYGWKVHHHFGDPYNATNRNVVKKSSVATQLAKYGIYLKWNTPHGKEQISQRIEKAKLRLHTIDLNETEYEFEEAIMQARYPKKKDNSDATKESTKPVHDDTSHFRTCLEYYFDNEPMRSGKVKKTKAELEEEFSRLGI